MLITNTSSAKANENSYKRSWVNGIVKNKARENNGDSQQINGREGETATLLSFGLLNSELRGDGLVPRCLNHSTFFFQLEKIMKTFKSLFCSVFLVALSIILSSVVFAQKNTLPIDLTEKSSIGEILNWLDKTSLPQARLGLETNVKEPETGEVITTATQYYEQAFFSKGFRVDKIDGCKVKLKNDDVELLRYVSGYPDSSNGSLRFKKTQNNQFAGEFFIPLQDLKANKAPFKYSEKIEKTDLLGTWRTEFKLKSNLSFFSLFPVIWSKEKAKEKAKEKMEELRENAMRVEIISSEQNEQNDLMYGDELTFTFDDKQTSEKFYAAFNRAITLCKDK